MNILRIILVSLILLVLLGWPSPVSAVTATPSPSPSPSPTPSPGLPKPQPGDIWISEALPNPIGTDTGQEWLEFFNRTDAPLDVSGLTVVRLSGSTIATITAGTSLGGEAFLKVDKLSGSIINSGDTLILKSGSVELDRITYDGSGAEGSSWSRISATEGIWDAHPTPGAANNPPPTPDPVPSSPTDAPAAPVGGGGTSGATGATTVPSAVAAKSTATTAKAKTTTTKASTTKAASAVSRTLPKGGPGAWPYLLAVAVATLVKYRNAL